MKMWIIRVIFNIIRWARKEGEAVIRNVKCLFKHRAAIRETQTGINPHCSLERRKKGRV